MSPRGISLLFDKYFKEILWELKSNYSDLEDYINRDPFFLISYKPVGLKEDAPSIVRIMADASKKANVGPMASVAGTLGGFGQASYSATKAGIIGFTKSIALEGARYNITCNAIVGGLLATDISKNMPDKMRDRLLRRVPMGKMGDPEDVANAVAFLASDRAKYITGVALNVTGGLELFAF